MKTSSIRHSIGAFFLYLAFIVFFILGFIDLIFSLRIIYQAAGFWGCLVAFVLFPVTLVFAPIYAIVAYHNWFPFIMNYGILLPVGILAGIGYLIYGKELLNP